jgi:hypothetical protein
MLLRRAGPAVEDVDWDLVRVRLADGAGSYRVDLNDPLGATEADIGDLLRGDGSLHELLHALGATREAVAQPVTPAAQWAGEAALGQGIWGRAFSLPTTYDGSNTQPRRRRHGT